MARNRSHHGARGRGRYPKTRKPKVLLEGTLHVLRPGVGQVETPEGTFALARRGVREGMNGDTVQVSLVPMHGRGGDRVAYVQNVIARATASIVGTYEYADPLGVVHPLDGRIGHDFFVLPEDTSAERLEVREGDVVSARIVEYPARKSAGVVTLERRLGSVDDLDLHMESVLASYGIATVFPPAVLEESSRVSADVPQALAADPHRKDLRNELCFTIDPVDARDFDDAVGAQRRPDGGYNVSVHIADVTHYVSWSSSMDAEARQRTCSVYLADRVVPMLPERLCNDVCSLRPLEDRLAMTVRIELDKHGRVMASTTCKSAICSRARLSYDEVDAALLDAGGTDPLSCREEDKQEIMQAIRLLDEVAQLRQAIRRERGSIDFDTIETKVELDDEGNPVGVRVRERTRATSLIEEAMLMANECVASVLSEHDVQTAYRVHEQPMAENLEECVQVLRELDVMSAEDAALVSLGDPHATQRVLDDVRGTGSAYLTNALLLRAQSRAIYLPHNDGHYALGAKAYCHFTSPIRRYPDVLVHRALKWYLAGVSETKEQLQIQNTLSQLCRTSSERERNADAAARLSQRIKEAELYAGRIGERYSAMVVGCERYGLFVMLDDTCVEGILPVRALGNEWYVYDEKRMRLIGESTGKTWNVGKRVAVVVAEVDVPKGRIEFSL